MMAELRIAPKAELASIAAGYLAAEIRSSLADHGRCCYCALSGGSSPKGLLLELGKQKISWEKVIFSMVDERFTNDTTQQNETMMREFVDALPAPGPKLHTILGNAPLAATVEQANVNAEALPEHLDIVVLGMGLDGHTASLFPDSTDYQSAMVDPSRYVKVIPGQAPYPRISMSYSWLSDAKQQILYIPGKDKLECFRSLLADPTAVSPIKTLVAQANNLIVFSSED